MYRIDREKLQAIIREIDQAIYNHGHWYQNLIRSIVCRLPFDERDIHEDAHHQCPFGQWYYSCDNKEIKKNMTFISIREEHKLTHNLARKLLLAASVEEIILPIDYDNFSNSVERLRLNLQALKYELEETLYNRDPLTGVKNRVSMLSDLRKQMTFIKRHLETTVIAIVDIDHFKQVNDNYGHPTGDLVLSNLASYILQHLRPYDSIYRYGGEEFLIMMPHTNIDTAFSIIERIRTGIENYQTHDHNDEYIRVTISAGMVNLEEQYNIETAIEQADKALYEAKTNGRNRSVVFK
ncbi:diguanylate cyclase [Sulfurovum sp. zt1-1]|uniref:diguanylate cyclase n=1 Tax=Sulfurovum zhangzhouensis TaxID=3019067 RepID=A0ABT7QXD7_9BACT|nr:diguanylate cyclase [Sulfurovum zhangzhouensis]MDM5271209.1 diguanylate cyclase [Sulfurovum zhangzhouensis]